uniref:Uncharacterized protein n=1 Tax=Avena sativa TaxID=4498 RepID=A0ACD5YAL7_AVESA
MASRGSGNWALVEHRHQARTSRVYRFQILLPNGTSTGLTLKDPGEEMPLHDFLHHIRAELENAPMDGGERRGIDWSGDVYLEDLLDRKIDKKVHFSDFVTKSTNILRLQDGEGFVRTFENMWDLRLNCFKSCQQSTALRVLSQTLLTTHYRLYGQMVRKIES